MALTINIEDLLNKQKIEFNRIEFKKKKQNMIGNIDILVKELCKLPKEAGWVEFKHNNCEPTMIGEDISALANTATLNDRDYAYKIWGVDKGGSISGKD